MIRIFGHALRKGPISRHLSLPAASADARALAERVNVSKPFRIQWPARVWRSGVRAGGGARGIARTRLMAASMIRSRMSSPSPLTRSVDFDEALPVTDRLLTPEPADIAVARTLDTQDSKATSASTR